MDGRAHRPPVAQERGSASSKHCMESSPQHPRIFAAARQYWSDIASSQGATAATRHLLLAVWDFLKGSTPSRLRQRFGDADYDWEYRVNTTSGAVRWRERLLGAFHSEYQPTEPLAFHEMLTALGQFAGLNFDDFTFVDLGSGKGRTLLMASDYPFRRIVGVELLPSLHQIAQQNIAHYKRDSQKCFAIESVCADATRYGFPDGPLLIYLFNPFPEASLRRVVENLEKHLSQTFSPTFVLYHNPLLEHVLIEAPHQKKIAGAHQYSVFSSTSE